MKSVVVLVAFKNPNRGTSSLMLSVALLSVLILSGCASQQEKPGALGVQMQSNTLAGSLQYGLKF